MKILSLFDGISVARVALERAGFKIDQYFSSEIDKYAIQIAQKNFPDTIQLGSVVDVSLSRFPEIDKPDLMILGSPCQDLSIAKKDRKGLDGERSGLFWEAVRIHKEVKPRWFIYENVNSMKREWKEQMLKAVQEVEPSAYMIMINAALVSAQNRKRIFITNIPNVIQPDDRGIFLKDILEENVDESFYVKDEYLNKLKYLKGAKKVKRIKNGFEYTFSEGALKLTQEEKSLPLMASGGNSISRTTNFVEKLKSNTVRSSGRGSGIDDKHNWDTIRIGQIGKGGQGDRIYSPVGKSVGLSALGGGRGAKTGLYYFSKTGVKSKIIGNKLLNSKNKTHQQDLLQNTNGKCRTIPAGTHGSTPHLLKTIMPDGIIRKLTPVECERLQGLRDNFTAGVSNSQRYKMLGNAFNCDVVAHILSFTPREGGMI